MHGKSPPRKKSKTKKNSPLSWKRVRRSRWLIFLGVANPDPRGVDAGYRVMSIWSEWVSVHCVSYYWSTARKTRLAPTRDAPETKSMILIDRGSKSFMLCCTRTCNLFHFLAPPLLPKLILKAQRNQPHRACCLHRLAQLQCSTLIQPLLLQFFSPFFATRMLQAICREKKSHLVILYKPMRAAVHPPRNCCITVQLRRRFQRQKSLHLASFGG